jgi:hypothetical protein
MGQETPRGLGGIHWSDLVERQRGDIRWFTANTPGTQDGVTHTLVYVNADLAKATQASEVLAFCEHWRSVSGRDPQLLVATDEGALLGWAGSSRTPCDTPPANNLVAVLELQLQ